MKSHRCWASSLAIYLSLLCFLLAGERPALASGARASLTLTTIPLVPGSSTALNLSLSGSAGPASLQWTLAYDPLALSSISVGPGQALAAAGKDLTCSVNPGVYQCIASGLNTTAIADGVVAIVTVVPSIAIGSIAIGVTNMVAAAPSGGNMAVTAAAGALPVVAPLPSLISVACSSASLFTPAETTCAAALSGTAPAGGALLAVSSDNAGVTFPASILVPPGSTSAAFTAVAAGVSANQNATITVAFNGAFMSVLLTLLPPIPPVAPNSLACAPASLAPAGFSTCTVILTGLAPPAGSEVTLASGNSALSMPATVMVPAGSTSAAFTIAAMPVAAAQPASINASLEGNAVSTSLVLNPPGGAAVLTVGPAQPYSSPCAALSTAPDGATIQIDAAGSYSGDVCTVTANDITIKGTHGRPFINAAGLNSAGKAAWVFQGNNITVDTVELTGAAGPGNNAAGIFMAGTNLTVLNSYLHDNQEGLVTGSSANSQILIQASEFNHNGFGDGLTHNLDIGSAARLTFQYNYSHAANAGDLVKSAAAENYILFNRLTSEIGTTATEIDLPNGGRSFLIGNLLEKGPSDLGSSVVSYLPAGPTVSNASSELYVVNNTMVSDKNAGITFLNIGAADPTPALVSNNIVYGSGTLTTQPGSVLNANFTGNPMFVNQAGYDYHLSPGSPAIDAGVIPAAADGVPLQPAYEYLNPSCGESRTVVGAIDIGAYEFGGAGAPLYCGQAVSGITINPNAVTSGAVTAGNVVLAVAAPSMGTTITLTSSNPGVAAVPASLIVPSGATAANFSIVTSPVTAPTSVTISAAYAGGSQSAALTVLPPPSLAALECSPFVLTSGAAGTCTVTLAGVAPPGGVTVNLSSGSPLLSVPPSTTVRAGAVSAPFSATAGTITADQITAITATLNGMSLSLPFSLLGLPAAPANPSPTPAAAGLPTASVLSWSIGANVKSYDVYFGTAASPSLIATVNAPPYSPPALLPATTYYWKIVANGPGGATSSPIWWFTTAAPAPASAPLGAVSVSPSSGRGSSQVFTLIYTDPNGYQSLSGVHLMMDGSTGCWLYYDPGAMLLWLANDDASNWSNLTPGTRGTLQNSYCSIDVGSTTASGSGPNLTLTVPITFQPAFGGSHILYMNALDSGGATSSYTQLGTWISP